MSKLKWLMWGALAAAPLMAHAQVDLTKLDRDMVGPKSQVLVLGTVHLSGAPEGFKPSSLEPVLAKLAAFRPAIITVERLPGEDCDSAARHKISYGNNWCPKTDAAMTATGLDLPAAMAEVDKTLKTWPAQPTPAQRRRLAAVFLAASDPTSALVQWLQLPSGERHAGDTLDQPLVDALEKLASAKSELSMIAAPLAARLGLQRVHAMDNHTGDRFDLPDMKAFGASIKAAWALGNGESNQRHKRYDEMLLEADALPLYRFVNEPESVRIHAEANVLGPMRAQSPEHYPRMWVGGWEIRNLRMVANIRETFRERPGAKVLSIVGASHKPWFDHWLGQLQGVEIVDVGAVLK